MTKQTSGV